MNEIEHIPLLSLGVIKTTIDSIDNAKLIEEIRSNDGQIASHFLSNKNHTYYEDQRYPFGKPESEKLITELTSTVNRVIGKEMVLSEIWTLTLKDGQSVSAHSHKSNTYINQSEYFSIAYYANAPSGSADLIFMVDACNTIETSVNIPTSTGDLVVFNSFLMHMTNRHNNKNEERVVISANFWPKKPDTQPTQDWSAYSRIEWDQYSDSINKSCKTFLLLVNTPFGEEPYTINIIDPNKAEIVNQKGRHELTNFLITDNKFKSTFVVNTPMSTTIDIDLCVENDTEITGSVRLGDFLTLDITGCVAK